MCNSISLYEIIRRKIYSNQGTQLECVKLWRGVVPILWQEQVNFQ
jgi:hypothetical protein